MRRLIVNYSEDFRRNKVASEIYARLRDRNIHPVLVNVRYETGTGIGRAEYLFNGQGEPNKKDLGEILKGITLFSEPQFLE